MPFPESLLRGYRAFTQNRLPLEQARFRELADSGQQPEAMVIGCCDSRVSPSAIFDMRPGELFTVRNVANLVPPFSLGEGHHSVPAALEFAVQVLQVKHVVVLGHARCGGVRAYAEKAQPLSEGDFIGKWMSLMENAAADLGSPRDGENIADYAARLEQASIVHSLANLMTYPFVAARVADGRLSLHGAYFGIASGDLAVYDDEARRFVAAASL